MFEISSIYNTEPTEYKTALQKQTYQYLKKLNIPFQRVDTDEAITMEDCVKINEKLDMKMVKTLFLCNRQKTVFFLYITRGDKSFSAKDFGKAVQASRVSFAPEELFHEMLGVKIGAATVFSTILDQDRDIQVVIEQEVAEEEYYGCSDGTTTCYMKIKTEDIIYKFLPEVKHKAKIIAI